jgi:hypothetical protein
MGRKGLGKLASFAIADRIDIHSFNDGGQNALSMSLKRIKAATSASGEHRYELPRIDFEEFAPQASHGTMVVLSELGKRTNQVDAKLKKRLARRFSILGGDEFRIYINGEEVTRKDRGYYEKIQFLWCFGAQLDDIVAECRNLEKVEKDNRSAVFLLSDGDDIKNTREDLRNCKVRGWIGTLREHKNEDEADNAVVVYSRGKLVHENMLKEYTEGGLYSKYIIGDVDADFLDNDSLPDIITSNRQTVDETDERFVLLRSIIRSALKKIENEWTELRRKEKEGIIETKVGQLGERLNRLQLHERNTAKKALKKLASVETLTDSQFMDMGNGMLTALEDGRLRGLMTDIAEMDKVGENELLQLLAEAKVMTSLHVAESVKTKLETINGLKKRVERQELENAVRDYIAQNPWLIAPAWETFTVENSLKTILNKVDKKDRLEGSDWEQRIDLLLASGKQLLLLEFMKP